MHGPFDRSSHIANINEWSSRFSIGKHSDLAFSQCACNEVVQYEIKPQPVGHAACRSKPQTRDCHIIGSEIGKAFLCIHFGTGISGLRGEFVTFLSRRSRRKAIYAAARRENEMPASRALGLAS